MDDIAEKKLKQSCSFKLRVGATCLERRLICNTFVNNRYEWRYSVRREAKRRLAKFFQRVYFTIYPRVEMFKLKTLAWAYSCRKKSSNYSSTSVSFTASQRSSSLRRRYETCSCLLLPLWYARRKSTRGWTSAARSRRLISSNFVGGIA